jgi:hypothetical protein
MRMLYGAAHPATPTSGDEAADGDGAAAGEVLMATRLDAGVDTAEIELARSLLRAYQARHSSVKFTDLRALPIDKAPDVSLAGDLQHQYSIPPEKIAVNAISDALGQVEVSWATDTVTKENLQLALTEEVGINGSLVYTPSGGALSAQSIPVRVRLADAETLGRLVWHRGVPWHNVMPYPLRLRYLHALLLESNAPVVYSWNLDEATVPPQARVEIDARTVPVWLDHRALRMWLDYVPLADCSTCDQQVIAAISGGTSSLGTSQITIHTITPLADVGAYEIAITVRSRYFDPKAKTVQTRAPLALDADNKDFTVGPLYLGSRQPGETIPGDPLFEYLLEVAMPDGSSKRGTRWLPADSLRLLIGKVQVEQALGTGAGGGSP